MSATRQARRLALLLAPTVVGAGFGCVPTNKSANVRQVREDSAVTQASFTATPSEAGRRIVPKRCGLSVAILSRPAKDPAVNEALWTHADEQVVPAEMARTLEANGLRVGLLTGALPIEVEAVLNPPPPGQRVDIVRINLPDGDRTDVALAASAEPLTLLLNRDGRTRGKDYLDARGMLRVTATHEGPGAVKLKIVPELHHGPVKQGYSAAPGAGPFGPQEFMIKNGQAEESFRDLAAIVTVRPGQVVAIGGRSDSKLGLGAFLFTQAEANSDRVLQRVVLIWAEPAEGINPMNSSGNGLAFGPEGDRDKAAADDRGRRVRAPLFSEARRSRDVRHASVKGDAPTP